MGTLANFFGSCDILGDPLLDFSLLKPCTYSCEVGILFQFSIFADKFGCVLKHHAKPQVCPSNPVILLGWAWVKGLLSLAHRTGLFFACDRICTGDPLLSLLRGYLSPQLCSDLSVFPFGAPSASWRSPLPSQTCQGLFWSLVKWWTPTWPFSFVSIHIETSIINSISSY